ncbi:hypothetical protein JXM67_05620 [candidate division WOR-3 bacterium]|nr:hypothetical protein [candidate division WOR-3 bacterium]
MRRLSYSIGLVVLLASGCGRPEELSPEQYYQVRRLMHEGREDLLDNLIACNERVWNFSIENRFNPVTYVLEFGELIFAAYVLPRYFVNVNPRAYRTFDLRQARRMCSRTGVSFASFDEAHVQYSLTGKTYTEELDSFLTYVRDRIKHSYDRYTWSLPDEFTEKVDWDRVYLMTTDLDVEALSYRYNPSGDWITITFDEQASRKIFASWGEPMLTLFRASDTMSKNPYIELTIIPRPETRASQIFSIAAELPEPERLYLENEKLRVYPASVLDSLRVDPDLFRRDFEEYTVFIEVKEDGSVFINSDPQEKWDNDIAPIIEILLGCSATGKAIISVDEDAAWKDIERIVTMTQYRYPKSIYLLPGKVIAGHEPRLNTEWMFDNLDMIRERNMNIWKGKHPPEPEKNEYEVEALE